MLFYNVLPAMMIIICLANIGLWIYKAVKCERTDKAAETKICITVYQRCSSVRQKIWFSVILLLTASVNIFLSYMDYFFKDYWKTDAWTAKELYIVNIKLFICVAALVVFLSALVFYLFRYLRYDKFRLCNDCFYSGGEKYDNEKYSYVFNESKLVFSSKNKKKFEITVPEDKREEVERCLEVNYCLGQNVRKDMKN